MFQRMDPVSIFMQTLLSWGSFFTSAAITGVQMGEMPKQCTICHMNVRNYISKTKLQAAQLGNLSHSRSKKTTSVQCRLRAKICVLYIGIIQRIYLSSDYSGARPCTCRDF
jgi:hypothetical protein